MGYLTSWENNFYIFLGRVVNNKMEIQEFKIA